MKKVVIFAILLTCVQTAFGQSVRDYIETNNARKSLQYAQEFINSGDFEKAYRQLKNTIRIKKDFAIAYLEMGRVCSELKKPDEAIDAYEKSFELDDKLSRAAFFECGEVYFQLGESEKAKSFYTKYQERKGSNYANKQKERGLELGYDEILLEREANLSYIAKITKDPSLPQPINLGKNINSDFDEYLPTTTSDGLQIVYTRQKSTDNEDVMISEAKNGVWSKSHSFGKAINTDKNEGMAKFETHGKAFYFAGCMREELNGSCNIYKAILQDKKVVAVKKVEGHLNSNFWDSQPSITCDGYTMYFSSSREGGQGGADLWVSSLESDGNWSYPKNLGPVINTEGDEEAAFISSDGKTLYFSSNGHDGQGDGDIFISRLENGQWSKPQNLGYPINSPAKELGFYVQGNGKTAYFASARPGGFGGLDIYTIDLPENLRPDPMVHLEGSVKDKLSGLPIQAKILIGRQEEKWVTESDENGWFFLCLPGNQGYSFQVNQEGYKYYIDANFLEAQENVAPVKVELLLEPVETPKPELVSNTVEIAEKRIQFFFDFDSYELNENAVVELKALANLLKKEDNWKVEVVGYADSKGDAEYNKILSEKRAGAIVNFLKTNGITIEKVIRNEGKGSVTTKSENDTKFRRVDVILRKY